MLLTRGEDDENPVTIDVRTDFVDLKLSKEFVSFSAKKKISNVASFWRCKKLAQGNDKNRTKKFWTRSIESGYRPFKNIALV